MDCIVHGVAKSPTQLSDFYFSTLSWILELICCTFKMCKLKLKSGEVTKALPETLKWL